MYQGKHIVISDFSGGYCGNFSPDQLTLNQAADLDQIVVLPNGKGWRLRDANTAINSTLNGGAYIGGLGFFAAKAAGNSYFVIVSGSKIYNTEIGSGTYTDRTGAVSVTASSSAPYSLFPFNGKIVGIGGFGIPWEIDPTAGTNAAVLTGTPPSAYGGFTANNRVFAFNTSSARSTLYWSVLANENDWTGSGSGSAVVGSPDDNGWLTAAAILNTNTLLMFKDSATYQVILTTAPFPIYTLFDSVGCVGKNAVVNVDGTVFWINQRREMVSTNGNGIKTYPRGADDLFNSIRLGYEPFIVGFRQKGVDYDWIVWNYTTSGNTTNSAAIVWDLINNCWLKCSVGYIAGCTTNNNSMSDNDSRIGATYIGTVTGGYIVQAGGGSPGYTDANVGTPVPYWRSGWIQPSTSEEIIKPSRLTVTAAPASTISLQLKYGFDFLADTVTTTTSLTATSTETLKVNRINLLGRGNFFQYYLGVANPDQRAIKVSSVLLSGKVSGQKRISAP